MWIKTTERVPEPKEQIWFCIGPNVFFGWRRLDGRYVDAVTKVTFAAQVSHWCVCPSPEPPFEAVREAELGQPMP